MIRFCQCSRTDRRGQIESLGRRLGQLFGQVPRGMWLPERIWEPALAADLADCGIEHTVLDDFHFHAAGLANEQLRGYYLTEAEGRLVALFAGDERLRYLIPFAPPEDAIAYLRDAARTNPDGVIVYADDAEKFGAWPGMRERMQNERWLHRFLDALSGRRRLAASHGPGPGDRSRAATRKGLRSGGELSRDARLVHAHEGRIAPERRITSCHWWLVQRCGNSSAMLRHMAEFPGEIPRSRRDVLPYADGQPPLGGSRRCQRSERG